MNSFFSRVFLDLTPLREHRAFRSLFLGRVISVFGLGMLQVMVSIQVFSLTGSSLHIALVNTVLAISSILGSFVGGVWADRLDRRRLILWTRALAVLGFVGLALNAQLQEPSLAAIYLLTAFDAAVGSASSAAFGAAVPAVIPAALLPSTGALMALSLDLGAFLAPALAGQVAARSSAAVVYWIVVALSILSWLVLLRLPPILPQPNTPEESGQDENPEATRLSGAPSKAHSFLTQTREAFVFIRRDKVIGGVLLIGFIQILFASPHVLIPEFVTRTLGGDEADIGLIYSAPAFGALLAGLTSGWLNTRRRLGVITAVVFTFSALGITLFGLSTSIAMAFVCLALVGVGDVLGEIMRFTILSGQTPDHLRGRISSLWQVQLTVGDALGGPLISLAARLFGPAPVIAVGGIIAACLTTLHVLGNKPLRKYSPSPIGEHTERTEK